MKSGAQNAACACRTVPKFAKIICVLSSCLPSTIQCSTRWSYEAAFGSLQRLQQGQKLSVAWAPVGLGASAAMTGGPEQDRSRCLIAES